MPFKVYSLKELIDECETSYIALAKKENLPISESKAKARTLAYACNKLCDYIRFLGKQIIPTTAEAEYLEAHCALKGIFRKQKTAAYGAILVKGLTNTEITVGTILIRKTDNVKYSVSETAILTTSPQEVKVICQDKGSIGNAQEGKILDFAVVTAGVESSAVVKLIGSGADTETDKDLLIRYLEVVRNVYHGGADSDYVKWALSVEGVNRAWCYPCEMGIGSVTVRIMTPTGFPDAILCQKVVEYIETVRPPTYNEFFVVSPIAKAIPHTLMINPDTEANRTAVMGALTRNYAEQKIPGGLLLLRDLHSAMLSVTTLNDYRIDYPSGNIQCNTGEYGILGEITWSN